MTAISTNISTGRAMMDARIGRAVSAGSVNRTDQTAFATALDAIDGALSSSTGATARASGADMKTRIDTLISDQVSAGTLTDDQAQALEGFYAQGPGGDDAGAAQAMRGPDGMRGPPPPPPPPPPPTDDSGATSSETGSAASTDATTTTGTASTDSTKQLDALISFLMSLRRNQESSDTYGTKSSGHSSSAGVLIDASA